MQLAAFVCVICVICGRINASVLNLLAQMKPQSLPQISLIYADKTQNNIDYKLSFLRNNAACCIPLRHLRNLRENIHPNLLNQSTQKKPQCLPQISLIYADKPQNHNNLTNCLSLRNNAACCIPLRDLRYLRENTHPNLLNQYTQKKPQYLSQISQIYADETQNYINQTNGIPLRYLRENKRDIRTASRPRPQTATSEQSATCLSSCHNHTVRACR